MAIAYANRRVIYVTHWHDECRKIQNTRQDITHVPFNESTRDVIASGADD